MRIAIIGTGIAGLTCAHLLDPLHDVTVFERDDRPGGHANTVRIHLGPETHDVDTGFIVYNERNYPGLVRLFDRLGIPTKPSDMSFSVSDPSCGLEWRATSLSTVFAQRRSVLRPELLLMLADIVRFNRRARRLLSAGALDGLTLRDLVARGRWTPRLVSWYLSPIVSAIWSAPIDDALSIPASTFARFFDNHGLLRLGAQPSWRTVEGGARTYVRRIVEPLGDRVRLGTPVRKVVRRSGGGVELLSDRHGPERFDHVILATHSDQSLELLGDASPAERSVLGGIHYRRNTAVLHVDGRLLPKHRRAVASWNYRLDGERTGATTGATVTYCMNRLQSIESRHQICVTLNQQHAIAPDKVLGIFEYDHPILDAAAVACQQRYDEISGIDSTWYCGAYWGNGFHEDGVQSALRVCRALGAEL